MEHLNRVQLRGVIGSVSVQEVSGKRVCRFTLATERAYKDATGEPRIDTTWHSVSVWEGNKNTPDFDSITRGSKVEVFGRIRNNKVENADGTVRTYCDIQATQIKLIDEEQQLAIEM